MQLHDGTNLNSRLENVWAALHDTELLRHCISGCEKLEWLDERTLEAELVLRALGFSHRYASRVHLRDQVPMEGYTLLFGKQAETASVSSVVRLAKNGSGTRITYEVEARLDGKFAKLGAGVIEKVARKMAANFFQCLDASLEKQGLQP